MKGKLLLALSGAAIALTAGSANAGPFVCTQWRDGICVNKHRVKGPPPYRVGYVFGPHYTYTTYSALPQPVVTYYHLGNNDRYVFSNGYIYVVNPTTWAVERVIDTLSH